MMNLGNRMVWIAIYFSFGFPALLALVIAWLVVITPFVHALNEMRSVR